jgi:FAD synthase
MIVVRDGETSKLSSSDSVIAIGVFDGLHRGHQAVIDMMLHLDGERARDAVPTVVTFDPHPARVLAPEHAPRLIGTLDQRLEGFRALGIEQVRVLTFDRRLAANRHRTSSRASWPVSCTRGRSWSARTFASAATGSATWRY